MTDDELKGLFDAMRQENRRHLQAAFERITHGFDLVAEALKTLDENMDRRTATLEERMERGFAETQALIKSLTPNWSDAWTEYLPSERRPRL